MNVQLHFCNPCILSVSVHLNIVYLDCEIFHLYSQVIKHIKNILINRLQLGDEQSHDNNADNISHNYQYARLFFVKLDAD